MQPNYPSDLLEELREFDTCSICNAIETFAVRLRNEGFTDRTVHCLTPELGPMVGYAVTVRVRCSAPPPNTEPYLDRTDWWDALATIPNPRVLIIEDTDPIPGLGALVGSVHAAIFSALGCIGAITNGTVRDVPDVAAGGFNLFAAGTAVSHGYIHIVDYGVPAKVAGLRIEPGDLLHADRHGVVSIPPEIASRVPAAARVLRQHEQNVIRFCGSKEFSPNRLQKLLRQYSPPKP